jgi:hypothetical protein
VELQDPVVAKPEHQEPQEQNVVIDDKAPQQETLRRFDAHSAFSIDS